MAGAYKRGRQRKPGGKYTATWVDEHGKRREKSGFSDKGRTRQLAQQLEDAARAVKLGTVTQAEHTARLAASKPIAEHVESYRLFVLSKGGTTKHAQHTANALTRLFADAGISRLTELAPEALSSALARLRVKRSARTANHALGALKSFLRFLWGCGQLASLPGWVTMLATANERTDRRRVRRVMSPTEIRLLLTATRSGPDFATRRGPRVGKRDSTQLRVMTGWDRYWLYRLALETGLRASELASLTPESFDLEVGTVKVAAAYSKHRRDDTLPLAPVTIIALGAHFIWKRPGERIFETPEKPGKMLARDLAAANIPIETTAGVIDFHSLRHTFISGLIERGTDPKTAQDLARHSTVTLTIDRYSHTTEARRRAAIEAIPTETEAHDTE